MAFSDRLKSLMLKREITNYKLAKKLGFSKSTITSYLNNKTIPKNARLEAISKEFNVSPIWFLTGEGSDEIVAENPDSYSTGEPNKMPTPAEMLHNLIQSFNGLEAEVRRLRKELEIKEQEYRQLQKAYDALSGKQEVVKGE